MKALVGAFNQEKALVGAFSVIVQPVVKPMDRFTALMRMLTSLDVTECGDITSDGLKIFESLVETRPSPYNHCQILR